MIDERTSTRITLWVGRMIGFFLVVLIFTMPLILRWYDRVWTIPKLTRWVIAGGFYLCLPLIFPALWDIDRMLCDILDDQVFTRKNVDRIRRIRWYCAGVGLICVPASPFFTPLYFLAVIMFFLAFIVSVIKNVMAAAVRIREENDLTI